MVELGAGTLTEAEGGLVRSGAGQGGGEGGDGRVREYHGGVGVMPGEDKEDRVCAGAVASAWAGSRYQCPLINLGYHSICVSRKLLPVTCSDGN